MCMFISHSIWGLEERKVMSPPKELYKQNSHGGKVFFYFTSFDLCSTVCLSAFTRGSVSRQEQWIKEEMRPSIFHSLFILQIYRMILLQNTLKSTEEVSISLLWENSNQTPGPAASGSADFSLKILSRLMHYQNTARIKTGINWPWAREHATLPI